MSEKVVREVGAEAWGRAAAAMLECSVPETVVGCALVGVFENFVGLVDLLETVLGLRRHPDCDPGDIASHAC